MIERDERGASHFILLDAGRGLAAIAVLVLHIGHEAGLTIVPRGYLAADFFLMLSGFVIARAYEGKLAAGMGLAAFLGIRAARLWPMIFVGGILASISMWTWPIPDWAPGPWMLWQFALIPSAVWLLFPANAPMWSLFYETIANVAHAAGLRRIPTPLLVGIGAALVAGAIGYATATGEYDVGFRPGEEGPALLRVFASYVAGVLLWRWLATGPATPRAPWPVPAALILAPLFVPKSVPEPFALALALASFVAAILTSLRGQPRGAAMAIATWLGGISYPLYAIHMPVMKIAFGVWQLGAPLWLRITGWLAIGVAALLAATLVERWWDAPIRVRVKAFRQRS